jgi:hypothetical protein
MTAGTLLITSGAYVGGELAVEFGRLPPAFLPVGNRRLFIHQHAAIGRHFGRVLLTLPTSFPVGDHDLALLAERGIELIRVDDGQSLAASILSGLGQADVSGPIAILHGDTLIYDLPWDRPDAVSVAEAADAYQWAGCRILDGRVHDVFNLPEGELEPRPILSGFFHFGDVNQLVLALAASGGSFIAGLRRYMARRPMEALPNPQWLDFGHLHTYYASRGQITTERAFNSLAVDRLIVAKGSRRADRMEAEASWYEQVPGALRIFLPNYLGRREVGGETGYALQFLYMASLADLFVFGRLPETVWSQIFRSCAHFLEEAGRVRALATIADDAMALYLPKTLKRLAEFADQQGIDLERGWIINGVAVPGLTEIARSSAERITPPQPHHLSVVHGDPCFSNIMYDFRSRSVRLIDPRGQSAEGAPTIWGDNRYDLAKLHHSIVGNYDLIVAGYAPATRPAPHELTLDFPSTPNFHAARSAFARVFGPLTGADQPAIEAISLHLFLSMLPLHGDSPERQWALLANALRLYTELFQARLAA